MYLKVKMNGQYTYKNMNQSFKTALDCSWCSIPLNPVLWRQRPANLCEVVASLVYRERARTATATQRNSLLRTKMGEKTTTTTKKQNNNNNKSAQEIKKGKW